MKVKITYLPGEEQVAEVLQNCAKVLLKQVKVNRSDRHAPYKHIYITTPEPKSPEIGHEKKTLDF